MNNKNDNSDGYTRVHGIDIGGTKIELVSYVYQKETLLIEKFRRRVATPTQNFTAFVEVLTQLIHEADAIVQKKVAVGIGLPGFMNQTTKRYRCANIPAIHDHDIQTVLNVALDRNVWLGNDAQCFALSESHGGTANGYESMVGIILGTGVGSGFCINGQLWSGAHNMAGEWGHSCLCASAFEKYQLPLYECPCGLLGCREMYISGTGLVRIHRHLGGHADTAEAIFTQAEAGDKISLMATKWHLDILAQCVAGLILNLDPHVIVFGGGLSNVDALYEQLRTAIPTHLPTGFLMPPLLKPHFGDAGGARGAALLAWRGSF
jgi:N-acetylglucosamine kinase